MASQTVGVPAGNVDGHGVAAAGGITLPGPVATPVVFDVNVLLQAIRPRACGPPDRLPLAQCSAVSRSLCLSNPMYSRASAFAPSAPSVSSSRSRSSAGC